VNYFGRRWVLNFSVVFSMQRSKFLASEALASDPDLGVVTKEWTKAELYDFSLNDMIVCAMCFAL
jgi:hypothetical protein